MSNEQNLPEEIICTMKTNQYNTHTLIVQNEIASRVMCYRPSQLMSFPVGNPGFCFECVFVVHNIGNGKYYVAQTQNVLQSIVSLFKRRENPLIYADYCKHPNDLIVSLFSLNGSSWSSIDELEEYLLNQYHAAENGYNKEWFDPRELSNLIEYKGADYPGVICVCNRRYKEVYIESTYGIISCLKSMFITGATPQHSLIKEDFRNNYSTFVKIITNKKFLGFDRLQYIYECELRQREVLKDYGKVRYGSPSRALKFYRDLFKYTRAKEKKTNSTVQAKVDKYKAKSFFNNGLTPERVLELAQNKQYEVTGVYVIHNSSNGKNYVGQATRVLQRLKSHFTGRGGNPDVYFDYRSGDKFEVGIFTLDGSGYKSLDVMESDLIKKYQAYEKGYNKTKGNLN